MFCSWLVIAREHISEFPDAGASGGSGMFLLEIEKVWSFLRFYGTKIKASFRQNMVCLKQVETNRKEKGGYENGKTI